MKEADRLVERGKTYDHAEHGRVEVSGIWNGVDQVDTARNADETDAIIVRYSTAGDGERSTTDGEERGGELADTLAAFLEAIE